MSEKHVLLATSSPNVGGGSYTDVIFARDADGKKLMNSVILGDPCDMCKAGPTPEACTHKQDELASWKDPRKMARLAKVYRAVGGEAILQGELHTMPKQSTSTLFPSHIYSDMLGSRPKVVDPRDRINAVYVGIDPAGGGKCEFALTAIGHVAAKREFQVIFTCAETLSTPRMEEEQIRAMVDGTISTLRSHPRIGRGVPIIVAIEGCSVDPIYIANMFLKYDDVLVMAEVSGGRRYGVPKDERITKSMVTTTQTMMSLRLITIPIDAIAHSTQYATRQKTMRDFREALASQFASFKLSQTTGKMSGKERGGNDDLLITFMMALYWMTRFGVSVNEDYMAFKQNYGSEVWAMVQAGALLPQSPSDSDPDSSSRRTPKKRSQQQPTHARL